jgi:NAD+ synthase (glutamine-hydrolysing)
MSTEPRLRIGLAQLNFLVGDVQGNATRVLTTARETRNPAADLIAFPELALSGYPPEDLLFHRGFRRQNDAGLERVRCETESQGIVIGYPEYAGQDIFNAAALIGGGKLIANHRKLELPNYKVFDEKRYFRAGSGPTVVDYRGFKVGILVCEDMWEPETAGQAHGCGAELLIVVNASPFEIHKQRERESVARDRIREVHLPIAYVNMVGGQDELVFDGNS